MEAAKEKNTNSNNKLTHDVSSHVKIPFYAWKVLAVLSLVATMVMYAETMLIPAIPDLIKDFRTSYSMSSWILTAYLVSGAVMTPIAGKLSDIYGKKKVLLAIMAIYTIGVSTAGFANNIYFMLVARAIQGIGMSMFPIAFSIIRDQFPREKISIGQGIITSMFASGAVIGLSVGGTIIQHFGWQATFFTIIPISISLLIVIWRFIHVTQNEYPEQQRLKLQRQLNDKRSRILKLDSRKDNNYNTKMSSSTMIDIKGASTLAATVTSFLLVLTFLQTGTNNSSTLLAVGFLAVAIVSLSLFIMVERRAASPLIDFKMMLDKTLLPANILIMIIGLSMFMVFQTIPILVRSPSPFGFGESAINTGNVQLPFALVLLVFGPTSGFIISKLGSLRPIMIGTIISAAGFIGLFMLHQTEFGVSMNLAILSAGLSLTSVGAMNVIILSTPRQSSGVSLGISSLMRIIGASIGPAVAGMYMQSNQSILTIGGIARFFPSIESYNLIFLTAAIVSIVSIAVAILLRQRVTKMAVPNVV
ncbi:MAG: MFS transporter [Candidatus Nitrosopolaris sp.]